MNQYYINVYYDVTSNDLGTRLDEDPIKSYETMFSASYINGQNNFLYNLNHAY